MRLIDRNEAQCLNIDNLPEELLTLIFDHVKAADVDVEHPMRSLFSRRLFETEYRLPKVLLNLRLVSKRFERLATPYIWERRQIFVGPDQDTKGLQHGPTLDESIETINKLCSRPDLVVHVKVLSLHFGPHFYTEAARNLLRSSIERLIELSPALRAFYLNKPYMLSHSAARTLLSRRSLQVLDIYDWPSEEDFCEEHLSGLNAPNVQALGLSRLDSLCNAGFVSKFTGLKSVYLRQFPGYYNMLSQEERPISLPWVHTIRELNVNNSYAPTMHQIGRAYESAGDSVPLREFAFNASFATTCVEPEEDRPTLEDVIHYLRKAKLEKLILYHAYNLSVNQLELIIATFPFLRQLALYSDKFSAHSYSSGGTFEDYAKVLKNAPNLEVLEWDNVLNAPGERGDQYISAKDMSLHDLGYDAGLQILAKNSPRLRLVRSSSFYVGLVDNYDILRDDHGQYQSFHLSTSKGVCLTTTSWDTTTTRFF